MEDCVPKLFFCLMMLQNLNHELAGWSSPFPFHLLSISGVLFFHSERFLALITPCKPCPQLTAAQELLPLGLGRGVVSSNIELV